MTDAIFYPKELGNVLDRALDRCFERINAGDEDSIAFLIIMNAEGEITDQRIAAVFTANNVQPMNNHFERDTAKIKIYALAFIALLRWRYRSQKAILIEAGELENEESMVLAQRYVVRKNANPKIRLRGQLKLVGMRESRIYPFCKSEL